MSQSHFAKIIQNRHDLLVAWQIILGITIRY